MNALWKGTQIDLRTLYLCALYTLNFALLRFKVENTYLNSLRPSRLNSRDSSNPSIASVLTLLVVAGVVGLEGLSGPRTEAKLALEGRDILPMVSL